LGQRRHHQSLHLHLFQFSLHLLNRSEAARTSTASASQRPPHHLPPRQQPHPRRRRTRRPSLHLVHLRNSCASRQPGRAGIHDRIARHPVSGWFVCLAAGTLLRGF
jgi:hypothetical protein